MSILFSFALLCAKQFPFWKYKVSQINKSKQCDPLRCHVKYKFKIIHTNLISLIDTAILQNWKFLLKRTRNSEIVLIRFIVFSFKIGVNTNRTKQKQRTPHFCAMILRKNEHLKDISGNHVFYIPVWSKYFLKLSFNSRAFAKMRQF